MQKYRNCLTQSTCRDKKQLCKEKDNNIQLTSNTVSKGNLDLFQLSLLINLFTHVIRQQEEKNMQHLSNHD